ncbi:MAG TPA: PorP/SprF family type IX secretion system membrane protein [Saprospiraceae bacterium]|nr:PorP/SprF family type IX secretion system membrane protein [Saprospiraceae bacterium]
MRKLAASLFILFFAFTAKAQQRPTGPLFMGTAYGWNPAMTAPWNYLEVGASYIQQWNGFDQAPRQMLLGLQYPFESFNSSLGLQLLRDETGPLSATGINFSYAYHIPTGYNSRLSIGLSARAEQFRYDPSSELVADLMDPLLFTDIASTQHLNFGAGVFFRTADMDNWLESHFFAGLSLQQALPSDLLLTENSQSINFERIWHGYALVGYRFVSDQLFFEPSAQLDYVYPNIYLPRFNFHLESSDSFWASLSIDGRFASSIQAGFIIDTRNYWQIRLGVFGTFQLSQQNQVLGNSYGSFGAYRFER